MSCYDRILIVWRVRMNGRKRLEYVNVWTSILSKTETKSFVFQNFLDAYGQGLRLERYHNEFIGLSGIFPFM